jgi:hypothetical protein
VSLSAALAAAAPGGTQLDGGVADARPTLLRWLKDGPGVLVYAGHGSLPMLGDEKLLTLEDAGAWNGPTVIAAWTCLCAGFTHPTYTGWAKRGCATDAAPWLSSARRERRRPPSSRQWRWPFSPPWRKARLWGMPCWPGGGRRRPRMRG